MTHPAGWTAAEPCPSCGSWDITEYEIRVGSSEIRMGWECRDCGHLATWTTRASTAPSLANERQLLSVMPLHAITTMYGEQGLRERFALETARLADPVARGQVKRALRFAARLHASDRRQREPYVNHLLRVALRIMVHYSVREPDVICAALLHNAVEDHAEELSSGRAAGRVRSAGRGLRGAGRGARGRGDQPGLRTRKRCGRAVPRACRGQPGRMPVGTGHQDVRLHRQRRRADPHDRQRRPSGWPASTRRSSPRWRT